MRAVEAAIHHRLHTASHRHERGSRDERGRRHQHIGVEFEQRTRQRHQGAVDHQHGCDDTDGADPQPPSPPRRDRSAVGEDLQAGPQDGDADGPHPRRQPGGRRPNGSVGSANATAPYDVDSRPTPSWTPAALNTQPCRLRGCRAAMMLPTVANATAGTASRSPSVGTDDAPLSSTMPSTQRSAMASGTHATMATVARHVITGPRAARSPRRATRLRAMRSGAAPRPTTRRVRPHGRSCPSSRRRPGAGRRRGVNTPAASPTPRIC